MHIQHSSKDSNMFKRKKYEISNESMNDAVGFIHFIAE